MTATVAFVGLRGGVGVTACAMGGVVARQRLGMVPRLVEVVTGRTRRGEGLELGALFPEMEGSVIALEDGGAFGRLYQVLAGGGAVVDVASEAAEAVLAWLAAEGEGERLERDGKSVDVVTVGTVNPKARAAASEVLRRLAPSVVGGVAAVRRGFVFSAVEGVFADGPRQGGIEAVLGDGGISVGRMDRCVSELWAPVVERRLVPALVSDGSCKDIVQAAGVDGLVAARGQALWLKWLDGFVGQLRGMGIGGGVV